MKTSNSHQQMKLFSEEKREDPEAPFIQPFRYFLKSKRYKESTIHSHINNMKLFLLWAHETNRLNMAHLTYPEIMEYVRHLKARDVSVATINGYMLSIRKYYEHLKEEGVIEVNPARKIHIRGAIKKIIINPLPFPELEQLYLEHAAREESLEDRIKAVHRRRTVILGLMIFQALHSGELSKLEISHVNLQKGWCIFHQVPEAIAEHLHWMASRLLPCIST
jgi:site-specific recombinase XerD